MVKVTELQCIAADNMDLFTQYLVRRRKGEQGDVWEDSLPKTKLLREREFKRSARHQGKYL